PELARGELQGRGERVEVGASDTFHRDIGPTRKNLDECRRFDSCILEGHSVSLGDFAWVSGLFTKKEEGAEGELVAERAVERVDQFTRPAQTGSHEDWGDEWQREVDGEYDGHDAKPPAADAEQKQVRAQSQSFTT